MAVVEIPRPLQGHVAITMEEGVPVKTKGVEDLGEDELGIYEDNAECADLTDSEFEDMDCTLPTSSKPTVLGCVAEGITVIQEEEEPGSGESRDGDDHRLQLGDNVRRKSAEGVTEIERRMRLSNFITNSEESKLNLPPDLHEDSLKIISPEPRDCPGVREQRERAPPINSTTQGDKSLVSFTDEYMKLEDRPCSASTDDLKNSAGLCGKANTPVSYLADYQGGTESRQLHSRDTSRLMGVESREAIYRQAMNLMSARCVSKQVEQSPWMNPFGIPDPDFFYVEQNKPVPMPPLKAWRGYNGNVYFEPIHVSPMSGPPTQRESDILERPQSQSRQTYPQYRGPGPSRAQPSPNRSSSLPTYPVKLSTSINRSGIRQMSVLDKRCVINRFNPTIQEDLEWIEGQENTGTLAMNSRRKKNPDHHSESVKPRRDRICKGLVSHKDPHLRKKKLPQLTVSGDKFIPPPNLSPLLRTLTQYSLSTTRVTNNSPEQGYEKLPPLKHLQATLRSINNSNEDPYKKPGAGSRHATIREEYKPLVKYSPDVKAKYEKHGGKMI